MTILQIIQKTFNSFTFLNDLRSLCILFRLSLIGVCLSKSVHITSECLFTCLLFVMPSLFTYFFTKGFVSFRFFIFCCFFCLWTIYHIFYAFLELLVTSNTKRLLSFLQNMFKYFTSHILTTLIPYLLFLLFLDLLELFINIIYMMNKRNRPSHSRLHISHSLSIPSHPSCKFKHVRYSSW